MTEFPFLIFRKVCYFCQDFDREANKCSKYDGVSKNSPACGEFVLKDGLHEFLDTEIFDEVEKAWRKREAKR
jgi:hypothetical protein